MDGKVVVMGGILVEAHSKATKKGSLMGFATLEDLTGQIECLIFPKVYDRCRPLLQTDTPLILTGHLSVREDEDTKLLVDRAEPLTAAPHRADPPEGMPSPHRDTLRHLPHPEPDGLGQHHRGQGRGKSHGPGRDPEP